MTNGKESESKLSEVEMKLFVSIMSHLQSDIAYDADAVAKDVGYKSGKVVRDRWSQIKKKRGIASGAAGGGGGVTKATPTKKSAAAPKKLKLENGDGDHVEETPTKGKGGRKVKAVEVKAEKVKDEEIEDDAEEDANEGGVDEDAEDEDAEDEEVTAGKPTND